MPNILLTGSSRGIGAAIRKQLEARGVTVIGHASAEYDPTTIATDLAKPDSAGALWQETLDRARGAIDAVILNAGVFEAEPLDQPDDAWLAGWERTLAVNLTSAAQLARLAVLHWQETGSGGRLVHVASRAGHRGDSPAHWHYAAAKGGMLALHKTIARAYAGENILSYAIAPGFTDTAMAGDYLESRGGPGLLTDIPLGRVATPDEIATIAVFCTLDAPPSMTGATLDANGASYVR